MFDRSSKHWILAVLKVHYWRCLSLSLHRSCLTQPWTTRIIVHVLYVSLHTVCLCVLTYRLCVCVSPRTFCVFVLTYLMCVCVCVLKYCLCPDWHLDVRYLTRCVVLKQPNQMLRNTRVYLYKHNISISLCTSANTHTTYIYTHTHTCQVCACP